MATKVKRHFKRSGGFHVYILRCADGSLYAGHTNDLTNRLLLHSEGKGAQYTRQRRPVKLVWSQEYQYFKYAFRREREIKRMTKLQKEKLVGATAQSSQREARAHR